jgi:hypothetical protein
MAMMPVVTVPAVMPTPVTVVPMMAVPVMAPADFLRLQLIDFGLGYHRGLQCLRVRGCELHRSRRKRSRVRRRSKRRGACRESDGEYQTITKFHQAFSLRVVSQWRQFRGAEMNAR